MEIKFVEAEVQRLNLQPGELLIVKLQGDEYTNTDLSMFRNEFQMLFPNNKVAVLLLPPDHSFDLEIVATQKDTSEPKAEKAPEEEIPACMQPMAYCNNCGCGKKEAILGKS